MCQGWCVRGLLEIYKLEIFEANCGLASDARGRLSLYWIEMKLQYICLDSALDLWPPGHFALGFFASRIGRSEMECSALGFSYVRWKPWNGQLAKMGSFDQLVKLYECVWECSPPLLWLGKYSQILNKSTSLFVWPLTLLKRIHF